MLTRRAMEYDLKGSHIGSIPSTNLTTVEADALMFTNNIATLNASQTSMEDIKEGVKVTRHQLIRKLLRVNACSSSNLVDDEIGGGCRRVYSTTSRTNALTPHHPHIIHYIFRPCSLIY